MKIFFYDICTLLWKDFLVETRTKEVFSDMLVFGVLVLLVFNFSFPPGVANLDQLLPGILWSTFIFSGLMGLNRSFQQEKDDSCLVGIVLSPIDKSALFLSKVFSNFLWLFIQEIFIIILTIFFFNSSFIILSFNFLILMFLGSLGFVILGTLFAAIAIQTRFQEFLLPILLIPAVSPVLIGSVKGTQELLLSSSLSSFTFWVEFLIIFDLIFLIVSAVSFEYIIQE